MNDAEVQITETMTKVTDRMSQFLEVAPVGEMLDEMHHELFGKVKETLTLCNPETHSFGAGDVINDQHRSLLPSPN